MQRSTKKDLIDTQLLEVFESEFKNMGNVLYRVVNIVKFLSNRGLVFRDSEEKIGSETNTNVLGIIELISQYHPVLAEHLVKYGGLGSGELFTRNSHV